MLAYLRTIDNGLDDISVKRIINVPKRGIGLTTIDRITNYAITHETSFYGALQSYEYIDGIGRSASKLGSFVSLMESFKRHLDDPDYSLEDLIREILTETGYQAMLEEEDTEEAHNRLENIQELINKAVTYEENCEDEVPTLSGFLEEVALVADIDNVDESNNLVLLMTLHSAKGLEFPYVYLVGMEDGIFPGAMAVYAEDPETAEEEMEEERRLCYVGITRAMKKLSLSCARSRFRNGEQQFNRPSRFISEIPRYLLKTSSSNASMSNTSILFPQGNSQSSQRSYGSSYHSRNSSGYGSQNATGHYSAAEFLQAQNSIFDKPKPGSTSSNQSRSRNEKGYGTGTWNPAAENKVKQSGHSGKKDLNLFAGNPMISKGFGSSYAAREASCEPVSIAYQEGDRVKHLRFGEGVVTKLTETAGDYEVTVAFDNGTTRKMIASFAKLKKI